MERYRFIKAERANFPVSVMCDVLEVSRSGFYRWNSAPISPFSQRQAVFDARVREVHSESRSRYGSRRVQKQLEALGVDASRNRVSASMRRQGLRGRRKGQFRTTTDSRHNFAVAPNLLKQNFHASRPNAVWVGDITYVPTDEGWLFLAVLIDLYSRRVVGWACSSNLERELPLVALRMAIGTRRPPEGLIHHSDRGSQYASQDYQLALQKAGIVCSMSRKGNCWDNAPAESFFASLKLEELLHHRFETRLQARDAILRYLAWYNSSRLHSTLNYRSPAAFEEHQMKKLFAA